MINRTTLLIIAGSAAVTLFSRILPFILTKKLVIPEKIRKWLSFVPICIFTALIVQEIINKTEYYFTLDWQILFVLPLTFFVCIQTKSMIKTVIAGVVCTALVRFFTGLL